MKTTIPISAKTKAEIIRLAAILNGQKGGSRNTQAQNKARRLNGKLGGRPKKIRRFAKAI